MKQKTIIKLDNVKKHYLMGDSIVRALDGVDVQINNGDFVVIIGPSGSGKCVSGDTELISTKGIPIQIKNLKKDKTKIFAMSKKSGKIIPFLFSNFYKRKVKSFLEIKTSSGKSIEVTEEHPFFTLDEKGFSEIKAMSLKNKMFIATLRKLNFKGLPQDLNSLKKLGKDKSLVVYDSLQLIKELKKGISRGKICKEFGFNQVTYDSWSNKNNIKLHNFIKIINECGRDLNEYEGKLKLTALSSRISVKIPQHTSPELMELYGYLTGDGNLDGHGLKITNIDKEIINEVKSLVRKIFEIDCKKFIEKRIDCNTRVLRSFFNLIFEVPLIKKSRNIDLPDFVFKCSNKEIAGFLKGLFDCDSYISKDKKEIIITLASKNLIKQLNYLLLRFGIISRYSEKIKWASNTKQKIKRKYYSLSISGFDNLKIYDEKIGFNSKKKNKRLKKHLSENKNTNVDVVPCGKLLRNIRRGSGISLPKKIHKILWPYEKEKINPSYEKLKKIIRILKNNKINVKVLEEIMKKKIFWDRIISIKKINREIQVYDITVPGADNFIANGFIIHNSTMMNMVGALDLPTEGEIYLDEQNIASLEESELAQIRGNKIGFVFQTFNLIPTLTTLENIALPMIFQGVSKEERIKRAEKILEDVKLTHRKNHLSNELSGGERQRVAIGRALANNPDVILADEPTGNLDTKTGLEIMRLFVELNKKGRTIILVTHDLSLVKYANKVLKLQDGKIVK